ncbi:MAG: energy transducer TonB [Acidobacteriota bacterium]
MFEQLDDTRPFAAETKNRRNYFLVTTVVLGITLVSAVIFSLFAVDLNLGMGDDDMVELVAPVEMTELPAKLPDELTQPKGGSSGAAAPKVAMRQVNMARIDESPSEAPTTVATAQNPSKARFDAGRFEIGQYDSDPGSGGNGRSTGGDGTGDGNGIGDGTGDGPVAKVEEDNIPPPPPARPAAKPVTQIMGVVNGRATSLPLPSLTAAAKAANASGTVSVQVLVDEKGNVISANAVSGSILLRASSEAAAREAKFSQTLLAGVPVKISGIINYHFEG